MNLKQKFGLGIVLAIVVPCVVFPVVMIFITGGVWVGLGLLAFIGLLATGLALLVSE